MHGRIVLNTIEPNRSHMSTEYLNNKDFERMIADFQESQREQQLCQLIIEDQKGTILRKKKRKADRSGNRRLLREYQQRYNKAVSQHETSKCELAGAFYILSENIVRYAKFQLIDEDDALQEGVVICFEKVDRFHPAKGRAFNYMTTCILNHFRQLYRSARNYNELKKKYHDFQQTRVNRMIIKHGKDMPVYKSFIDS